MEYKPSTNKNLKTNLCHILLASWWAWPESEEKIKHTREEHQKYLDSLKECVYCGRLYDCDRYAKMLTTQSVLVTGVDI